MRAIKILVPKELSAEVLDLVFDHGVAGAVMHPVEHFDGSDKSREKVVIDVETSTPTAKAVTGALISAPFFDRADCSVSTRQPRAIISNEKIADLTVPWVEPAADICQELWQFSHITLGFAGRVLISGGLLAFGIIHQQLLLMIAGMLFLPLLPIIMGIGFGAWTRDWGLLGRASLTVTIALLLLVAAGVGVALLSQPPVKYNEFNSLPVSLVISFAVGVAAALANTDDGGRRELIGLAATAQIAVIPVWLGVCAVLGLPLAGGPVDVPFKVMTLLLNILIVIVASLGTYLLLDAVGPDARKHRS